MVWKTTPKWQETFFSLEIAAIYWAIWKTRNKPCFDGKLLNNAIEVICHVYTLLRFYADLQNDGDKEMLINGVNAMLKIALKLLAKPYMLLPRQGFFQMWMKMKT